jgi:hypothetical protein
MAASDLTTIETLKLWLPIAATNTVDDATISRLITACSDDFMRATARPDLLATAYDEVRVGDGSTHLVLYHWPIAAVTTLTVGTETIAKSADKIAAGWFLDADIDPERRFDLWLAGGEYFTDGDNVKIAYLAGYVQPGVPVGEGIALPEDIEQAVIDWCAYRYKERPNVGATNRRAAGGEASQTPLVDTPPNVLQVIERYKRKMPCLHRRDEERQDRLSGAARRQGGRG